MRLLIKGHVQFWGSWFSMAACGSDRPNSVRMEMQAPGFSTRLCPDQGHSLEIPRGISTGKQTSCWWQAGGRTDGRVPASQSLKQTAQGSEPPPPNLGRGGGGCCSRRFLCLFKASLHWGGIGWQEGLHGAVMNTGSCLPCSPVSCMTLRKGFISLGLCFLIQPDILNSFIPEPGLRPEQTDLHPSSFHS